MLLHTLFPLLLKLWKACSVSLSKNMVSCIDDPEDYIDITEINDVEIVLL